MFWKILIFGIAYAPTMMLLIGIAQFKRWNRLRLALVYVLVTSVWIIIAALLCALLGYWHPRLALSFFVGAVLYTLITTWQHSRTYRL
jgi:hypothetical protein